MSSKKAKVLECVYECNMPDVGAWKVGDTVTDPVLVEKLADHPYFKIKEDK